jgi:carbon storage regulator
MLKLKRQVGQKLYIGNEVTVEILEVTGYGKKRQVRIGITAPDEITIYREELYIKLRGNKVSSRKSG